MTPTLTYLEFLVLALVPPIAALLVLTWRQIGSTFLGGSALVIAIGLVYTMPWDNALIAQGVWWYGEGTVLATLYLAPVEEYLFMLSQPILTALWIVFLRSRLGASKPDTEGTDASVTRAWTWTSVPREDRFLGAGVGLLVSAAGLVMLAAESTFYMGAILAWAGPVLAVQWAFGWRYLWENRRLTALAVGVPTAYLAAADRVAIELGIWVLSERYTTGLLVAGLPVEEGAFFLLTNVFVVQGLLLYLWVMERPLPEETAATTGPAPNP